jgi:hypothetical protein
MTKKWQNAFSSYKGKIQVWKFFEPNHQGHEGLYSPFLHAKVSCGWNKSNRKSTELDKLEKKYRQVNLGCHVIIDPATYLCIQLRWPNDVMVPVYVLASDFVAAGNFEDLNTPMAVFTKFFLRKQDYNDAMNYRGIGMALHRQSQ